MIRAILSDIHANLEALRAVLADARAEGATEFYCLGDLIGYGPDPAPCVDLVRKHCRVVLKGNHEESTLQGGTGQRPERIEAIRMATQALQRGLFGRGKPRWNFLKTLPSSYREENQIYVHASPRDPINEYLMPNDPRELPEKLRENFKRIEWIAFVGHTHVPGRFTPEPAFIRADPDPLTLGPEKQIINVGSVGQPRDRDPRSCYVLFDGRSIRFRRVEYDHGVTSAKILAAQHHRPFDAHRLAAGE